MYRSIILELLSEPQRRTFDELDLDVGDRFYIRKLAPVSDEALLERTASHPHGRPTVRALATDLQRHPATIRRRLRQLSRPKRSARPNSAAKASASYPDHPGEDVLQQG